MGRSRRWARIAASFAIGLAATCAPGRPASAAAQEGPEISWADVNACVKPLPEGMKAILFTDLGHYHHAIATDRPEAQLYFDQGLTLLYTFNHPEAIHSFRQATELDPAAPMPYWGIGIAAGPDINTGATAGCLALAAKATGLALAKAAARVPGTVEASDLRLDPQWLAAHAEVGLGGIAKALATAPPAARQSLEELGFSLALSARYRAPPDPAPFAASVCREVRQPPCDPAAAVCVRGRDYANAMHAVAQGFPDDDDGLTLYADALMNCSAWKWWLADDTGALHATRAIQLAIEVLKRVVGHDADHPGANHYLIHAVEESPAPQDGLPSADRLPGLAPGAGHFAHMPSHIYRRTGRHDLATDANIAAIRADERYIATYAERGLSEERYPLHYLGHNMHFLTVSLAMQGREAEALDAALRLGRSSLELSHGHNALYNQMLVEAKDDYFLAVPLQTVARFGSWERLDTILDAIPEARRHLDAGALPVTAAMLAYAEGLRYVAGASAQPAGALDHYRDLAARVRSALDGATTKPLQFGNNNASDVMMTAAYVYAARLAEKLEASHPAAESLQLIQAFFAGTAGTALPLDAAILAGADPGGATIAIWQEAVRREDALSYNEPSDWYYPTRESLGAAYFRHGDYRRAEAVFLYDAERTADAAGRTPVLRNNTNPDNPRSLYGVIECRKRLQEPVPPALIDAYRRNWKGAAPPSLATM